MPAASEKQKKLMDAAAHNPAFAKKVGIPTKVAKEFSTASKGQKFGSGAETRADRQKLNKPKTDQGKNELFNKGGDIMMSKMNPGMKAIMAKKMGKPTMKKGMDVAKDGMKKMAGGGAITKAKMGKVPSGGNKGKGEHAIQSKGISKGTMVKMSGSKPLGMKSGGKC
jgi:hypothetical protein